MFDHFTDRAKKIFNLARRESERFHHEYLGTEHMLLGILREGTGVGSHALRNMGVDLGEACAATERVLETGPPASLPDQLPFTTSAKKVLELSMEESGSLGHNYIGSEHLLLGLIRENGGTAATVLKGLGVGLEDARKQVQAYLDDGEWAQRQEREQGREKEPARAPPRTGAGVFGRFTDRAKKTMNLARQEAQRFNHEYLGTEHVLLGLVLEGGGPGASVLRNMGIDLGELKARTEKQIKACPSLVTMGKIPFTPRCKKMLELAIQESKGLGHDHIGSEHLLLGLIGEGEGLAARELAGLGAKLEDVRAKIREFLGD